MLFRRQFLIGFLAFALVLGVVAPSAGEPANQYEYDVVVYGSSSGGLIAAYQVAKMGKSVAVISPIARIGGMTTNGLGEVDTHSPASIGGLTREYFTRINQKYGQPGPRWSFEPRVALQVFQEMMAEESIPIFYERLRRPGGVSKTGSTVASLTMESGSIFRAKVFIDATYEGDLMAEAGVTYTVGRESNSTYGEQYNGIRTPPGGPCKIVDGVSPYVIEGDPASGLLPGINPDAGGEPGTADNKAQAYNYRMVLAANPANRIMIAKPEGYNEADYELIFRAIEKGQGWFSLDYVGMGHQYADADYATREQIAQAHERWQKGLVYTFQHLQDIKKPDGTPRFDITQGAAFTLTERYKGWGLPLNEFTENGGWPLQLYVRESRRMVSDFVMTEKEVLKQNPALDPVAEGDYLIDIHDAQLIVGPQGYVQVEGGVFRKINGVYPISYRAITPKESEADNLLVIVTISASHSAYGSLRMEPVFMKLGQAAGTAAVFAIDDHVAVQHVNFPKLYNRLVTDGQVLTPLFATATTHESEQLTRTTSGAPASDAADPYCSSGLCSHLRATAIGQYVEYTLMVSPTGTYNVKVRTRKNAASGKFRLYLPQAKLYYGDEQDLYSPSDEYVELNLGYITFGPPGLKRFRFIVTDKNPESAGYELAFDYVRLSTLGVGPITLEVSPPLHAKAGTLVYVPVTLKDVHPFADVRDVQFSVKTDHPAAFAPARDQPLRMGTLFPSHSITNASATGDGWSFVLTAPPFPTEAANGNGVVVELPFYALLATRVNLTIMDHALTDGNAHQIDHLSMPGAICLEANTHPLFLPLTVR